MLAANSVLLLLVLFTPGCYGDEYFSHLVLLDELPAVFGTNATPDIVIRTNYSVSKSFTLTSHIGSICVILFIYCICITYDTPR